MKNCIKFPFLTIILSFNLLVSIYSYSANIQIQRVFDTGIFNTCITQDKDGLLWFGTEGEKLCCYDGNGLKKAKILKDETLFPMIWSIFVDKEGAIWFSVQNQGLYSYDKNTGICKRYKSEPGNPNSLTCNGFNWLPNNITEDKDGLIWFGTADGLNSFDKKSNKFTQYKNNPDNSNSLSNNSVWSVFVDCDGLIWIGTENGLNSYNKKTGKFRCYKHEPNNSNSLGDNFIRTIAEDKENNLWIGTKNTGIDRFNKKTNTFTNYRHDPNNLNSLSYDEIHHIMIDRFNNLWICNEGNVGIDCYNDKTNTFKNYRCDPKDPNSIIESDILFSFEDNTGIIWLLDYSGGISKCTWKQDVFKNYSHDPQDPSSISSEDITRLFEDKKGNIWIGTYKGGLNLYMKNGKFENFKPTINNPFSLPSSSVSSILDASEGKLWLGFADDIGSVNLFDINSKKVIKSFVNPYSNCAPFYLIQDNKESNILWFTFSYASGLFKLNTTTGVFTQYKHIFDDVNSVSNAPNFSILQDGNILWIGTGGSGLTKFDKQTEKCIYYKHDPTDKSSISGDIVFESYIDSKGHFWVTTEDGGLNQFDRKTGKFTTYGINCGFPSNSTRCILEDNEGNLWIGTDSGIAKFDPKISKVVKLFTKANGLLSNQFARDAYALKDSNGNFWFSGGRGVCKFNPDEANKIQQNLHIPPVVLKSFISKEGAYNEQGVKKIADVVLSWPDNSFEFTFAVLDYTEPSRNQHAYKLEGFDEGWHYIGTNNFGQYANLAPGEYVLRLKGANNDGIWNEKGASVKITIEPALWQTWWFKGLLVIAIVGIIFGVLQFKMRAFKKKTVALEKHNKKLNDEIDVRKKTEIELAKTTATLHKTELEAEKNHVVAEVVSLVAHDVRKPFIGLKMMLQILPKLTPEQIKIYSEDLDISIRKVDAMLMDIMEASREMKYELIPENILSVLDLAIKDISCYHPNKNVDFYYNIDTIALIDIDELRMCRAFENITDNAFYCLPEKKGFMWFTIKKNNNKAEIIIGNSHSHISKDQINKIFQNKFTSGKKEGTGLGLSIVTKVIKGHNGSITVRNVQKAPDFVPTGIRNIQGVEFEITLPLTDKSGYNLKDPLLKNSREAKAKFGMIQKKNQLAGSSEIDTLIEKLESLRQKPNLLILDDESIYRMRVRDVLENLDEINRLIHAYDAGSYKEAVDILNNTKIDYLICDIDLSNKRNDGFSVLSKTLEKYPRSMVLIHTSRKELENIKKAKTLGACGFCPKPITEAILVDFLLDKKLWR
jgi:ligand-binding sensor domain-containing protein/signal transduction histidine kinase/ActR/RegA family two-component response regulator